MTSPNYSHHFSIHNLPYGIASSPSHHLPQCVTRLHNTVIFLGDLQGADYFSAIVDLPPLIFNDSSLNRFTALPKRIHHHVREILQDELAKGVERLPKTSIEAIEKVKMHLPVEIPNFTDFSCSLNHVQNAGRAILNNPTPPPGFFHFPIGYTGRASSVVVSGTKIVRPMGHFYDRSKQNDSTGEEVKEVIYAASRALDYELELGIVVGAPVETQQGLKASDAEEHIFGVVVVNDWSARDIQSLEMTPLGPLNGKSFATTISPWIVTIEALTPFRASGPTPRANLPVHLQDPGKFTYDIELTVEISHRETAYGSADEKREEILTQLSTSNADTLFWGPKQMLAHVASTGCGVQTGELLGTGTVSGTSEGRYGCLLEITEGGKKSVKLNSSSGAGTGPERMFLQDGDVVRMVGMAGEGVGFGECVGEVGPALF